MKKIFGIFVPLFIIAAIAGLLLWSYSAGRKGLGCDLHGEPGMVSGKKDAQKWIDEFEKYKSANGKYPAKLDDLDQSALNVGRGYSHPNVTGIAPYFRNENNFEVSYTFKNDYVCLTGQSRRCTYRSESKDWSCD